MLGGMRAVTWTQIAQYIVLIVAYLVANRDPVHAALRHSNPGTDLRQGDRGNHGPRGPIGEGRGWRSCARRMPARRKTLRPHISFMNYTPLNFFGIIFLHDGRHGRRCRTS